jgi:hypothetical protein
MFGLQSQTYACTICRIAQKRNPHCPRGHEMMWMGRFWRAPKKNNIKAWQRVAQGDKLWDDKAIERKAKREAKKRESQRDYLKFKARNKGKPIKEILEDYRKYRWGRWER